MFKKAIVTISIACIIIGSISVLAFAYTTHEHGINRVYNGSYWGDQAWLNFEADSTYDYYVKMYVKKGTTRYGYNRTPVYKGNTHTCYSLFVAGSGGKEDWDIEIKTGYGK